jgi:hypothetical protein
MSSSETYCDLCEQISANVDWNSFCIP